MNRDNESGNNFYLIIDWSATIRQTLFSGQLRWLFTILALANTGFNVFHLDRWAPESMPLPFWIFVATNVLYAALALQNWLVVSRRR